MSQEVQLPHAIRDEGIKEHVVATVNGLTDDSDMSTQDIENNSGIKFKDWGFQVDRLFEVAYRFYKRNESKAFHPSFDVRNQMNALILQARYGNYDDRKAPDLGTLDLVGKSRRYQWSLLKGLTKTEAKSKFICTLDNICPFFKAYADAVKISSEPQLRLKLSGIAPTLIEDAQKTQLETDEQLKAIRTSLNRQTYNQFKNYAEKQYPDDHSKQKYLIDSLQDQYYKQYISQMQPELNNISDDNISTLPVTTIDPSGPLAPHLTSKIDSILAKTNSNSLQSNILPANSADQSDVDPSTKLNTQLAKTSLNHESTPIPHQVQSSLAKNLFIEKDIVKNEINEDVRDITGLHNENLLSKQPHISNSPTGSSTLNHKSRSNEFSSNKNDSNHNQDETYQSIAPKNIGKFESFPEPVPYRKVDLRNSQASTIVDLSSFDAHSKQATSPKDPVQNSPSERPQEPPLPNELPSSQSTYEPANQQLPIQSSQVSTSKVDTLTDSQQLAEIDRPEVETWSCRSSSGGGSPLQTSTTYEPLEQASIWTKKGVFEFRESLGNDKHGGTYIVKQATSLTIQVPTYPDGRYIYWEFATEDYDIGFGLDFIYELNLERPLALKIYEETDEDDDYDLDECEFIQPEGDLELANQIDNLNELERRDALLRRRAEKFSRAANSISIVPTYRRDSHEEVFVGRHKYPGQGYYLLKFDNTYSVLRSKTLYFRVCYFI